MRVIVASVLSHLVVRPRRFWKIKEMKMKMKINNDLAIVASQYLEGRFMTNRAYNLLFRIYVCLTHYCQDVIQSGKNKTILICYTYQDVTDRYISISEYI